MARGSCPLGRLLRCTLVSHIGPWPVCFVLPGLALGPIRPIAFIRRHLCQVFHSARFACPYLSDRESRCFNDGPLLGPDDAEVNAHSTCFLLERQQGRKQAGAQAPVRTVPWGLEPAEHFEAGLHSRSPLEEEPMVPDDLDFAVRTIVEKGSGIDEWRQSQFERLEQMSQSVRISQLFYTLSVRSIPGSVPAMSTWQEF